jgi:hypothetical protein
MAFVGTELHIMDFVIGRAAAFYCRRFLVRPVGLGLLALAIMATRCFAVNDVAGPLITFNDNGAWSWFEDERVIVDTAAGAAGKIIVSSVAYVDDGNGEACTLSSRDCDVEVVSYDIATKTVSSPFTLSDGLQADDHDSAGLLKLPDGRYLASYSKHSNDRLVRWRVSAVGDATSWGAQDSFSVNPNTQSGGTTYSNLYSLSESGDIFNFHREAGPEGGYDPHYLKWNYATDDEFTYGGRLLTGPEGNVGSNDRPYLRYTSNGVDRIDFITTDAHPRNLLSNSVYHGYLEYEGSGIYGVYKSDGTRLGPLSSDNTSPYKASDFTPLLVGNTVTPANGLLMTRGWGTDIQLDTSNQPYAVFTARVNDNSSDHRFFYARHTAGGWNVHELAKAGGGLYSPENDYTGLVALDPHNPNRLFMSSNIDPRTNSSMPRYEIFEGTTSNGGEDWSWQPITYNSTVDNLRPIVPKWDGEHTALLWMRGTYTTYEIYDLDIVGLTEFEPIGGGHTGTKPPVLFPVAGPWTNAVGFGAGPITNGNTSSPTVGDGSPDSAAQEMIHSPFPEITLANSGDKIVFTGSVTLTGTINSPANEGNPKTQFRFGLFDGDAEGSNDNGWVGYYISNRHGNAGGSSGVLALKPEGNTSAYLSAAGQSVLASVGGDGTSASLFHDGTYSMTLQIERSGNDLVVYAELEGSNGFTQSLIATNTTAATLGTYTFDRLGFLLGDNLDADQAAFSNLLVTYVEAFAPGDFNGDDMVDAADYVIWRKTDNAQIRYSEWRHNYGRSQDGAAASGEGSKVPEPAGWLIAAAAVCLAGKSRQRC